MISTITYVNFNCLYAWSLYLSEKDFPSSMRSTNIKIHLITQLISKAQISLPQNAMLLLFDCLSWLLIISIKHLSIWHYSVSSSVHALLGMALASGTIPTFSTISCDRLTNSHPNLVINKAKNHDSNKIAIKISIKCIETREKILRHHICIINLKMVMYFI